MFLSPGFVMQRVQVCSIAPEQFADSSAASSGRRNSPLGARENAYFVADNESTLDTVASFIGLKERGRQAERLAPVVDSSVLLQKFF